MAGAVESAGKSIVTVSARRRQPASGVVWAADGVIVHRITFVEHEDRIRIGLPGGETVTGTLVG